MILLDAVIASPWDGRTRRGPWYPARSGPLRTCPNEPVHAWLIRAGGRQSTSRSWPPPGRASGGTASPASARTPISARLAAPRRQGSAMDRPLLRRQGPAPWLGCAPCWRSPRDSGFRCYSGERALLVAACRASWRSAASLAILVVHLGGLCGLAHLPPETLEVPRR
jgi:hypothetical protein